MRRRPFLRALAATAAAPLASRAFGRGDPPTFAAHLAATVDGPRVPFPDGRRAPFGWPVAAVPAAGDGEPLRLRFPHAAGGAAPTAVRFSIGLDYRADATVTVSPPGGGPAWGTAEVRFTQPFQPFTVALAPAAAAAAVRDGVDLAVAGGPAPLWVLGAGGGVPPALAPHLLVPGTAGAWDEFFRRLDSPASVQPFGWMAGCVLDGLLDLADGDRRFASMRETAAGHLGLFAPGGRLDYEDGAGRPVRGRAYGIEGTLPFAAAARLDPTSPLPDAAVRLWRDRADAAGVVADGPPGSAGKRLTGEGTYTVAYPMAVIGRARGDAGLIRAAVRQVRAGAAALFDGETFHRVRERDGRLTDRGWARGVAWHLLGTARTLAALDGRFDAPGLAVSPATAEAAGDAADLAAHLRELADWAVARQLPPGHPHAGLWSVFVEEPDLPPDTSGSAGIAAALAIGFGGGRLGAPHAAAADRCRDALAAHLTPDGFLGGAAQSNKGGRGLQAGSYRVLYQMGMGLAAQLIAARGPAR